MKRGRSNADLALSPLRGRVDAARAARGGRGAALDLQDRLPPQPGPRADPPPQRGRGARPRRRVRSRPWPQGRGAAEIPYRRSAGDCRLQAADRKQRQNLFSQERAARTRRRARSSHRHRRWRDDARGVRGAQPRAALRGARQASAARRGGRVPARRPDRSLGSERSGRDHRHCRRRAQLRRWRSSGNRARSKRPDRVSALHQGLRAERWM